MTYDWVETFKTVAKLIPQAEEALHARLDQIWRKAKYRAPEVVVQELESFVNALPEQYTVDKHLSLARSYAEVIAKKLNLTISQESRHIEKSRHIGVDKEIENYINKIHAKIKPLQLRMQRLGIPSIQARGKILVAWPRPLSVSKCAFLDRYLDEFEKQLEQAVKDAYTMIRSNK